MNTSTPLCFALGATLLGLPLLRATVVTAQDEPVPDLERVFEENGIRIDLDRKLCAIDVSVTVRDELLEYLLVSSHGAAHESLFVTDTNPSVLNTAMLALGVQPGRNARWGPKDPAPSAAEVEGGVSPYNVELPTGDGFFLYAAWEDAGEVYFYRIEDLLRNLSTGRAMQRHRWVYLGSRMVEWDKPGQLEFAAEMLGNLINIAYFAQGDTILTGALADCVDQAIWMANPWLVPERGSEVSLIFSIERLDSPPSSVFDGRVVRDR